MDHTNYLPPRNLEQLAESVLAEHGFLLLDEDHLEYESTPLPTRTRRGSLRMPVF